MRYALKAAVKRAGLLLINPHGLRHTMTRAGLAAGVSVKAMQDRLGHASALMTLDLYGSVEERQRMAVGDQIEAAISGLRDRIVTIDEDGAKKA